MAFAAYLQMPPIHDPAHSEVTWLRSDAGAVPKSAIPNAERSGLPKWPLSGFLCCLLLGAGLLAFFHWNTSAQFQLGPEGDSSYFVEMTQYFYIHESPSMYYPTMHSR